MMPVDAQGAADLLGGVAAQLDHPRRLFQSDDRGPRGCCRARACPPGDAAGAADAATATKPSIWAARLVDGCIRSSQPSRPGRGVDVEQLGAGLDADLAGLRHLDRAFIAALSSTTPPSIGTHWP